MKTLLFVIALLVAVVAWMAAIVDFTLSRIALHPRPHLVPGRTFFAVYYTARALLHGYPVDPHSYRFREYPRPKYF